jgi:Diguanylate cyclase, GGDEF domain
MSKLRIKEDSTIASAFGQSPGQVISWHGSAGMSSPCFPTLSTGTPLTRLGCALFAALKARSRSGEIHTIGASVGAALIPDNGTTAEGIVHNADLAMYRAKGQDRPSLVFFENTANHPRQIA